MRTDLAPIHDAGFKAYPADHGANPHLESLAAAWRAGEDAAPELARAEAWWDGLEAAARKAAPERSAVSSRPRLL